MMPAEPPEVEIRGAKFAISGWGARPGSSRCGLACPEPGSPFLDEPRPVDLRDVVQLKPAVRGGLALDVHHPRVRVHDDLAAVVQSFRQRSVSS